MTRHIATIFRPPAQRDVGREMTLEGPVKITHLPDGRVSVCLEEPGATGYSWSVAKPVGVSLVDQRRSTPRGPVGVGLTREFVFSIDKATAPHVSLELKAPWDPEPVDRIDIDLATDTVSQSGPPKR